MLSNFRDELAYLIVSQKYRWLSFFTYRTQSLIWLVYNAISGVLALVPLGIIYGVSNGVAGWSYFQMLFLAATASVAINIIWYLVDSTTMIWQMRHGSIDAFLSRPYGLITLMVSQYSSVGTSAAIISAACLLVFAALHMQLSLSLLAAYAVLLGLGTVAFFLFTIMLAALSYKLLKSGSFMMRLGMFLDDVTRYPLSAYGVAGQLLFTLLIPVGFAYYYPSHILFGSFNLQNFLLTILASAMIAVASYKLFYRFMRSYTSAMG